MKSAGKLAALFAAVLCLLVSSCAAKPGSSPFNSPREDLSVADFTGPYAEDFYNIYKSAQNPAVAQAVSDSNLSRQDIADIENLYAECMSDFGYLISFDDDMGESLSLASGETFNDQNIERITQQSSEKQQLCYKQTSLTDIQKLNSALSRNPNKEDLMPAFVKCLIAKGLAPQGYTVGEFKYDNGEIDNNQHGWVKDLWNQPGTTYSDGRKSEPAAGTPVEEAKMSDFVNCQNNPLELPAR